MNYLETKDIGNEETSRNYGHWELGSICRLGTLKTLKTGDMGI